MSSKSSRTGALRIVIALDNSDTGHAALETARQVAAEQIAELRGLFVEDVNVVRLAALPCVAEVDYSTAVTRRVEAASLKLAFDSAAELARASLARLAQQLAVRWSFSVARGELAHECMLAAQHADLLIIGRQSRLARPVATHTKYHFAQPVVTFCVGNSHDRRRLQFAASIALHMGRTLVIIAPTGPAELNRARVLEELRQCVATHLGPGRISIFNFQCDLYTADTLTNVLVKYSPSLVVVDKWVPTIDDRALDQWVNDLACPIAVLV
jgi:nucleotide-binding universal stress UspA family protein